MEENMNDSCFSAVPVSPNVWWVGARDWSVRNFHGYETGRGSTYNAFLVIDEKVTVIDAVKAPFMDEMLARIASVIDPQKVDIVISNHSEPDHSGGLPRLIDTVRPEKVYASMAGTKTLGAYYGLKDIQTGKTGDSISVGRGNISFVDTKMLHWPDSMVSFYDLDNILFSQDAFGMHLASSPLWADECDRSILDYEARKYFANILNLQADRIIALLDALPGLGLDIKIIAPDHGPLWRRDLQWILDLYREAAEQKYSKRALVAFSTMWHATEKMAKALAEGLRTAGIEVALCDLDVCDRSAVMTEVARSGLVAFGAPTMNNQVFPKMADVLNYVKGLRPRNKIGFAFGAYGWSGEGGKQIAAELEAMGFELPEPLCQIKYMPSQEELCKIVETGKKLGTVLSERCQ